MTSEAYWCLASGLAVIWTHCLKVCCTLACDLVTKVVNEAAYCRESLITVIRNGYCSIYDRSLADSFIAIFPIASNPLDEVKWFPIYIIVVLLLFNFLFTSRGHCTSFVLC